VCGNTAEVGLVEHGPRHVGDLGGHLEHFPPGHGAAAAAAVLRHRAYGEGRGSQKKMHYEAVLSDTKLSLALL